MQNLANQLILPPEQQGPEGTGQARLMLKQLVFTVLFLSGEFTLTGITLEI